MLFTAAYTAVTVSLNAPMGVETVLLAGAVTAFAAAVTVGRIDLDITPF